MWRERPQAFNNWVTEWNKRWWWWCVPGLRVVFFTVFYLLLLIANILAACTWTFPTTHCSWHVRGNSTALHVDIEILEKELSANEWFPFFNQITYSTQFVCNFFKPCFRSHFDATIDNTILHHFSFHFFPLSVIRWVSKENRSVLGFVVCNELPSYEPRLISTKLCQMNEANVLYDSIG